MTLEHGLGQTIYFSDRPERIVGAAPTEQFLKGLGFTPANPPNAALVLEAGPSDEDIAVLELFNPHYDASSKTATYDVQVLQHDERLGMTFAEQPTDLGQLHPTFGAAHLFIDDCSDYKVGCCADWDNEQGQCRGPYVNAIGPVGYCYNWGLFWCMPCDPFGHNPPACDGGTCSNVTSAYQAYWAERCDDAFAACDGHCTAAYWA